MPPRSALALLLAVACTGRPAPSAAEDPVTAEGAAAAPEATPHPATDQPATDEPAADQPATDEPATDDPADAPAENPVSRLDPGEAAPVVEVDYEGDQAWIRYRGPAVASGAVTLRVGFDGKVERPGTHPAQGAAHPTGQGGGGGRGGFGGAGRGGGFGGAGRGGFGGPGRGGFGGPGRGGSGPAAFVLDQAMTVSAGLAETRLALPPDTRALSLAFVGADGRVDDNGGEDYHSGAVFPYIGPFLTWGEGGDPATSVTVTWETSRVCRGVVLYGADAAHLDRAAVGERPDTLHHVRLTGLIPGATVHYQVTECGSGRRSEVFGFDTIPADATRLDVAVIADMQDKGMASERWGEIARQVVRAHGEIDVVIAPGDLAGDDEPRFWWLFFDRARALLATTPIIPAVGNHDTPGRLSSPDNHSFLRYFPAPRGPGAGGVHARRVGPLLVLTLNSEVPAELQPGGAQYDWIDQQLDAADAPWIFAQWHVPPYNAGDRFAGVQWEVRPVTTLFDGRLDWVFTGHEHLYQRTLPIRDGQAVERYGRGEDEGVGYAITPTAGDRIFNALAPATEPTRQLLAFPQPGPGDRVEAEHGYLVVHIDGDRFDLQSWGMGTRAGQPARIVDELRTTRR